jgi:hypothetical protein
MGSTQSQKPPPGNPSPARSLLDDMPSRRSTSRIMRDDLMAEGFQLSDAVGQGQANKSNDVFNVEKVLSGAGLLNRKPGTRFDMDTARAIGEGQKQLNRDYGKTLDGKPLKIDGLINPEGPTQTATAPVSPPDMPNGAKVVGCSLRLRVVAPNTGFPEPCP